MRIIIKKLLLTLLILIVSTIIGFYDYEYNKSFYHFFMFMFFLQTIYITNRIETVVNKLYELHKKWLGFN